ncbi:MAG: cytoplasmic protein [Candidatus Sulfotelmatobacter sp.]
MRVRTAILNKHKSYWKGIQRDVDRVLRELSVTEDHIAAHKWSGWNRSTLNRSDRCGCFYCLEVFPPNEIEGWTDDGDTALCPKCGIDSVIGSVSGYPIRREFLSKMHDHWF